MIRAILLIINMIMFGSGTCFGQYSDQQLYRAYLNRDIHVWEAYLTSTDFAQAPLDEQLRYLNYQYGYVAYAISIKQDNARRLLTDFEANLETLRPQLPEAAYFAYKASTHSYELSLNHWQFAKLSKLIYSEVSRALSADAGEKNACCSLHAQRSFSSIAPFGQICAQTVQPAHCAPSIAARFPSM